MNISLSSLVGSQRPRHSLRAAALAIALAGAGMAQAADWAQFQSDAGHSGVNASEAAFTPANVASLGIAWKGVFGSDATTEGGAVIVGDTMFVTGFDGKLSAFAAGGCEAASCLPLWQGAAQGDITSTPAVASGRVAFPSQDGFVHVFDAAGCGAQTCDALWRGQLSSASIESSVVIADDLVYVGDFDGQLSVFALAGCGHSVCAPLWTGHAPGQQTIVATPAVGAGFVFVQTSLSTFDNSKSGGRLLAFPAAGCGHATCDFTWSADLGGPSGTRSAPVIAGDKVIVGSTRRTVLPNGRDHVFAFTAAGCGKAVCKPIQTFDVGPEGLDNAVAASGSLLFVASSDHGGRQVGVVSAYDLAACRFHCPPLWTGVNPSSGAISPPAVAGDLVFVGKGPASFNALDAGVYAFDVHGCGRAHCKPLTFVQSALRASYLGAPLAIAGDRIAFVSGDNSTLASEVSVMTLGGRAHP